MHGRLYALLTNLDTPGTSFVEIVNLATMKQVALLPIPTWSRATSLAVSPNERWLYVTDWENVHIVDAWTGSVTNVPMSVPIDCVLSRNGDTLFIATSGDPPGPHLIALDTTFYTMTTFFPGALALEAIALSPDGRTLAVVGNDAVSTLPTAYLLNPATMSLQAAIPLVGLSTPSDIAFVDNARVVIWDSWNDALYQIDVPSATVLGSNTVQIGPNNWLDFMPNEIVHSKATNHLYTLRIQDPPSHATVVAIDPVSLQYNLYDGFSGTPYTEVLTRDGLSLLLPITHIFEGGGAATLDVFDTVNKTFTRNVYTFASPTMMVNDAKIPSRPFLCFDAIKVIAEITQILAGVGDDAPGVVIPPGGGPGPGPVFRRTVWDSLPPQARALLAAFSVSALAPFIGEAPVARNIQQSALDAALRELQRISRALAEN